MSSRIMPCYPSINMSVKFGEDILNSGGLRHLLNVLDKDALPFDVDTDTRQECRFSIFFLLNYYRGEHFLFNIISFPLVRLISLFKKSNFGIWKTYTKFYSYPNI